MRNNFAKMKWLLLLLLLCVCGWPQQYVHGADTPVDFDCGIRKVIVEYGFKIQPFRSKRSFQELVDTLNLPGGDPDGPRMCKDNVTVPADAPDQFLPKFKIPESQTSFFVAVDGDDDTNDGSMDKPFRTTARALTAIRKARLGTGKIMDGTTYGVVYRAGTHFLGGTIELTPSDRDITFQNYDGEQIWISGAIPYEGNWTKHPKKKHVWVMQIKDPKIESMPGLRIGGERAVRARYPNGCTSDKPLPSGYKCAGYQENGRVVHPKDGFGTNLLSDWVLPPAPQMKQDDWFEFMPDTPTRKHGKSYNKYMIGVGGNCAKFGFTPPAGYWCSPHATGGAPQPPKQIVRFPLGVSIKDLPNAPYKNPGTAIVQSWRPGHWASWMFEVSAKKSNATHLMFSRGGFQGGRGEDRGEGFFVENVEEELDADNEYFFNEEKKELLYYSSAEQPPSGSLLIPTVKRMFSLQGDQSNPVQNIHFLGLGFRDQAYQYLDEHQMASGGDWGVPLRASIELRGTDRVSVDSCTFEEMDGNVMMIKGYNRGVVVQNNDFHMIGGNIIAQLGETEAPGVLPKEYGFGWNGTAGNQPRGTVIRNNFAYRCGLFPKQSSLYFQAKSMDNLIQNNIFFHGPRAGINLNDGFGGGNVFEGNLLFSTVMETGDHGPFNSWDRQPYAHEFNKDGTPNMEKKVDTIRGNFFMGNYYTQETVDNDDGSWNFETHHNVFVYGTQAMKSDFDGHTNILHHNIYAFIRGTGMSLGPWNQQKGEEDQFWSNTVIKRNSGRYIELDCNTTAPPITHDNKLFTPDGKIDDICSQTVEQRDASGIDKGTTVQSWPKSEDILQWSRTLLNLSTTKQQNDALLPSFLEQA